MELAKGRTAGYTYDIFIMMGSLVGLSSGFLPLFEANQLLRGKVRRSRDLKELEGSHGRSARLSYINLLSDIWDNSLLLNTYRIIIMSGHFLFSELVPVWIFVPKKGGGMI